jgi:Tfp pilus assembly protein PilV
MFSAFFQPGPWRVHQLLHYKMEPVSRSMGDTMTPKSFNAKDGFTLLEAMIATLILGFVLASVLAVLSQCARYVADIRHTARASQILQQEMENIRLTNVWSSLTGLADTTFSDPSDTNHLYAGTIAQANYVSYGSTTTVVKVTLTVTWTNQINCELTNTLTALVGNGGLNKYIY